MPFFAPSRASIALSAWLSLMTLAAVGAGADPGTESTITVAYAESREALTSPLAEINAEDAERIEAETRATLRADLDASLSTGVTTLLAAARPQTGDD